MAHMVFPPSNWNQSVNTIDTVVLDYTSSWSGINLTLFCLAAQGTGDYIWWDLPGPLPSSASYYLHLSDFDFKDSINIWPTPCHFQLVNSGNKTQAVNGGYIPLTTASAANVQASTYSEPGASSSASGKTTIQTLSSPTGSGSTKSSGASATPTATGHSSPTKPADASSSGLSSQARIGIGIGVGLGVALLLVIGVLSIILYRRRRRQNSPSAPGAPPPQTTGPTRYEKAELSGNATRPLNELPASQGNNDSLHHNWNPPQELGATAPMLGNGGYESKPAQRYELGA